MFLQPSSKRMSENVNSDDIDGNSAAISVVHMPSLNQPVQVQSVIHSNQPSVIQTAGPNIQTIQVVRVAAVDDDINEDCEGKKRREILSRRPSYRKILNELSSPVTKMEEESNSSQSQDGESQEAATNLSTHSGVQFQQGDLVPSGAIQITSDGTSVAQGLQTLTMTNASPTTSAATGATIVQYAQGPDGQFYIPGTVQAYQIATSGSLPQGVVMATAGSPMSSPTNMGEEASRKRELRLLKNREAARECRRKKKDYVKCLENRVAVLENQNKTLIEELKALKELYCQKEG